MLIIGLRSLGFGVNPRKNEKETELNLVFMGVAQCGSLNNYQHVGPSSLQLELG